MAETTPLGFGDPTCPHTERREGVCVRCDHCEHDVILNGACFACGTTDLGPIANTRGRTTSPEQPTVIPTSQLVRKKP